jgi:hypothetical protein
MIFNICILYVVASILSFYITMAFDKDTYNKLCIGVRAAFKYDYMNGLVYTVYIILGLPALLPITIVKIVRKWKNSN